MTYETKLDLYDETMFEGITFDSDNAEGFLHTID